MALVNTTLSCTAMGTATVQKSPSILKTTTGTVVPILLRLPQKRMIAIASSGPIISLIVMGVDVFDIIEGKRKWIVNGVNRFQFNTKKRFTFLVRGKPYG